MGSSLSGRVSSRLRRTADRLERPSEKERRRLARQIVGGMWDEIGPAQLAFLVGHGLQPGDTLLDIGCGALRGGVHFIAYLDPGNYVGVDRAQWLLDVGRIEMAEAGVADRDARLVCDDSFDFGALGLKFDVAYAHSVFTHIPLNSIHRCLVRTSEVLRPGGVLYASFLENTGDPHDLSAIGFAQPDMPPTITYPDRNPYRYHVRFIEDLVEGLPLKLEHLGEWRSVRGQSMLAFHRL